MVRLVFAVLTVSLLLVPLAASDDPDTDLAKPTAALGTLSASGVTLSWLPGVVTADLYNAYGIQGTLRVLLGTAIPGEWSMEVPAGYESYEVTGVTSGVETSPTAATLLRTCLTLDHDPPTVAIGECLRKSRGLVKVVPLLP